MNSAKKVVSSINDLNKSINLYRKKPIASGVREATEKDISSLLSPEDIEQIKVSLESYNDIIKDGPGNTEVDRDDTQRHLRSFLDKYSLKVDDSIYSKIEETDFVEIYSNNNKQMFRSVNFFSYCSYDLSTLTFTPWDQLYHRQKEFTSGLENTVKHVVSNRLMAFKPRIPAHILTEVEFQKKFRYEAKFCGCVVDRHEGALVGYITIASAKEIKTNLNVVH